MLYFGFILSIIVYFILIAVFGIYSFFVIKKKYKYAIYFEAITFFTALLATMILSWSLIMMNGGFNVNLSLNITFIPLYIIVPIVLGLLIWYNIILREKKDNESILAKLGNYFLPPLTLVAIFFSTLILIYNFTYFIYILS